MNINNIICVKFLKNDEFILNSKTKEIDIEFDDLLLLISDIENIRGLGKLLHKEAYEGIDYLGNNVVYNSYVCWDYDGNIYKYNFNKDYIPFNNYIIKIKRDKSIKKIIKN